MEWFIATWLCVSTACIPRAFVGPMDEETCRAVRERVVNDTRGRPEWVEAVCIPASAMQGRDS